MADAETPRKFVIRRARLADADAVSLLNAHVQALHAEALPWRFKPPGPATFPPAAAAVLIGRPENIVFVAEADSATVGYVYAERQRREETAFTFAHEMVYIHHISVRPDFRERDVGEALLDAVRAAAAELKIDLITLDVWSFNASARSFFRRNGFTIYNERLWNRPE
ncbi:MAG TPA: N-acetyltransferase [Alphaproteobacteria bacterium]|jgi:ribosomal protein S18 acetylase RimI-like enzyme